MSDTQTITATEARNNFFSLIDQSMFEGKRFIVEKNGRPWAELRPSGKELDIKKSGQQIKLLKKMYAFSKTLPKMEEDVVTTLRRLRNSNV